MCQTIEDACNVPPIPDQKMCIERIGFKEQITSTLVSVSAGNSAQKLKMHFLLLFLPNLNFLAELL